MSPIEKLKAEAVALRGSEKAAGREMKHCDALEIVAKKHGYANWRACLAILSKIAPSDGTSAAAKPASTHVPESQFRGSPLLDGDFTNIRERSFTRWMTQGLRQMAVEFSGTMGLWPIYSQISGKQGRYLFWQMPAGALCEVRSARSKEKFLELNRRNHATGRRLLTLHISDDELYSAVWISGDYYASAVQFLDRFGIGSAEQPHS